MKTTVYILDSKFFSAEILISTQIKNIQAFLKLFIIYLLLLIHFSTHDYVR